jgi:cytoplasmic iron level regulating protein YaaA (DUF328/UPF0246 family)
MLMVISPSKTLDFETRPATADYSLPEFTGQSEILVKSLKKYTPDRLSELMGISPKLAELNRRRFAEWALPFSPENAKPAVLAFKGDVYEGLRPETFSEKEFQFAQAHLRVLSGLYGVLRPLDLIQPYRLEMGTRLPTKRGKNLYLFWGDRITDALNDALAARDGKTLVNLASNEYFKAVNVKRRRDHYAGLQGFQERKIQGDQLLRQKSQGHDEPICHSESAPRRRRPQGFQ